MTNHSAARDEGSGHPDGSIQQGTRSARTIRLGEELHVRQLRCWIDYGKVVLRRDDLQIVLEWNNWCEGEIEAPEHVILELGLEELR